MSPVIKLAPPERSTRTSAPPFLPERTVGEDSAASSEPCPNAWPSCPCARVLTALASSGPRGKRNWVLTEALNQWGRKMCDPIPGCPEWTPWWPLPEDSRTHARAKETLSFFSPCCSISVVSILPNQTNFHKNYGTQIKHPNSVFSNREVRQNASQWISCTHGRV